MDEERARALLHAERVRVNELLNQIIVAGRDDQGANRTGDRVDSAERVTAGESDDTLAAGLRERLAAIGRAERRIAEGTYGYSIRSGAPIPEARLEADPAAELTVEEAQRA